MFVTKMSGPHNSREQAEDSMRVFIRVTQSQDEARKQAWEAKHPGRTWTPFSPAADDIYRIEQQQKGFIVVLDDPSL